MATATGPLPGAAGGGRISLSEGTLEVFLRVLAANAGLLPSDTLQLFKMVQAAAVQAHPQLAGVAGDSSTLEAFAPDIGAPEGGGRRAAHAGQVTSYVAGPRDCGLQGQGSLPVAAGQAIPVAVPQPGAMPAGAQCQPGRRLLGALVPHSPQPAC